jgi:hypothetical protein
MLGEFNFDEQYWEVNSSPSVIYPVANLPTDCATMTHS